VTDISFLPVAAFGSHWEVWIILLIILILFGSRLPGIARSLGQGINQFKKGLSDSVDEDKSARRDAQNARPDEEARASKAKVEETK
jgi:sec-independent protein translocase protein TatA